MDHPEIGVAYEYHLYVHCGVDRARFGGRDWRSVIPTDGRMAPNDGSQYVVGSMTLISPTLARFDWDGRSADFLPVEAPQPTCA